MVATFPHQHAYRFTPENLEVSDYLQEGDVGFKKPKVRSFSQAQAPRRSLVNQTKKKRPSRRAPVDVELGEPEDAMLVDQPQQ